LTLTNGVAIGIYGGVSGSGIALRQGAILRCEGTAPSPNRLVRYTTVQEQPLGPWTTNSVAPALRVNSSGSPVPQVQCRFTEFSVPTSVGDHVYSVNTTIDTPFGFTHCQFFGGWISAEKLALGFTNCLWHQVYLLLEQPSGIAARYAYNNLFYGGTLIVEVGSGSATFYDNLFDRTVISQSGTITHGNNGYVSGYNRFSPNQSTDVILTSVDYKSGPLGPFYYPTNGVSGGLTNLVNKGSRSGAAAALYHFCTQVSLAKETNSTVDIGFHYVATDANGNPIDTDGDGLPDYLEDSDGDGVPDSGETNWEAYNSGNGLAGGSGLEVFTPLK
jgi:hypothetical protein